ncbi:unnamed protein product [Rotaria sp. Silwood2]|nr:unnamed protein product [Rotaria sp. Silwood2]CAF3985821.1 unnamed protein product [Rotaria sp. Silwood2]
MDKNVLSKPIPGIYSTSLINVDRNNVTTMYHPLRQQLDPNKLTVDSSASYNYRSRANSNIIERRFSNVEQPTQTLERVCNGQQRSRNPIPGAVSEFRRPLSSKNSDDNISSVPNDTNEQIDIAEEIDVAEQIDTVEPIMVDNTPGYAKDEEQYRYCRRSSVQFLDKKLVQSLSSAVTSTVIADDDFNAAASVSEAECEF